jgi:hypothetical protein
MEASLEPVAKWVFLVLVLVLGLEIPTVRTG